MHRADAELSRWIWLITFLGLVLRLYGLASESLWLDEVITARRVHEPLGQILLGWDSETQGPLYYVWVKCWGLLAGTSEWMLRIWSVVWGTFTIPVVYSLGRQMFNGTTALLAAAFLTVHPFAIHYSQEARPYALFLFLATVSFVQLLRIMRQHSWERAWLYILVTAAAFYTHAFGVFLVLSHLLIYWRFRNESAYRGAKRYPMPYVKTLLLLSLICLPEVVQNALAAINKVAGDSPAGWIPVPGWIDIGKMPVEFFMHFNIGGVVLGVAVLFALFSVLSEPQQRPGFQWLLMVALCFWIIPWLVSISVTPIYVPRYSAPLLLVMVFLMAMAPGSLQSVPRAVLILLLFGLTCFPLRDYYTKIDKDPWRQAGEYLSARVKDDDVVVCYPFFAQSSLGHYLPDHLKPQFARPRTAAELEQVLANHERVWQVNTYKTNDVFGIGQLKLLESWGKEVRRVNLEDELQMNPNRYWSAPVIIILRQQLPPEMGPPAAPES